MLQTHSLSYVLPSGLRLIDQVNMTLERGKIVGLLGPNGSGKTTLFSLLLGLLEASEGEIFLGQESLKKRSPQERIRLGLGYLPQEGALFQELSVFDNLLSLFEYKTASSGDNKAHVTELLNHLGLTHLAQRPVLVLSGRQKRRLEFGRILATQPRHILLDEPFAGVDPKAIEEIQQHILELKKQNIGIFISDHNIHAIEAICDEVYLLMDGKIAAYGPTETLMQNEALKERYFGYGISKKKVH